MSGFYYWLPTEQPMNSAAVLQHLRAAGLGYAVEDRITSRGSDRGPDAMKGLVVCHGPNTDGRLGFWPEEQVWKKIPGAVIWCGMSQNNRPGPDDLARAEQVTGEWIVLDDGNRWLAPKARRWLEINDRLLWDYNLPRRMTLNDEGLWQPGDVKPKYERLWQLAMAYLEADEKAQSNADADGTYWVNFPEMNDLAIGALQVNYRVGPIELDMLGIYDNSTQQSLIRVLLDSATYAEWHKKKLAEFAKDQPSGNS